MTGIARGRLEGFRVFGEPVYAPCDGEVLSLEDGHEDMPLGEMDPGHVAGNHVILACNTSPRVRVRLAHFRNGSLGLQAGQALKIGDRIAEVGNSGNTTMPHLHIEAQNEAGEAVPLFFGGRYYRGYDRYKDASASVERLAAQD